MKVCAGTSHNRRQARPHTGQDEGFRRAAPHLNRSRPHTGRPPCMIGCSRLKDSANNLSGLRDIAIEKGRNPKPGDLVRGTGAPLKGASPSPKPLPCPPSPKPAHPVQKEGRKEGRKVPRGPKCPPKRRRHRRQCRPLSPDVGKSRRRNRNAYALNCVLPFDSSIYIYLGI